MSGRMALMMKINALTDKRDALMDKAREADGWQGKRLRDQALALEQEIQTSCRILNEWNRQIEERKQREVDDEQ